MYTSTWGLQVDKWYTSNIQVFIKNSRLIHLRWSIFKQYLTPRKTWTIIKLLFCRKYTLLYAVIMCFIIISQVQSKNNKQWNKVTNSTGENCILGKPLSHGVFQTTSICCKLTWCPSADLGCFKLHGEYYMSSSRKKPPIFTSL
jgi:hypothetical protein